MTHTGLNVADDPDHWLRVPEPKMIFQTFCYREGVFGPWKYGYFKQNGEMCGGYSSWAGLYEAILKLELCVGFQHKNIAQYHGD